MSIDPQILGEVAGIFAGDGSLYQTSNGRGGKSYVLEVRGPIKELNYYTKHIKPKFEKVLSRELKIIKRTYERGYVIGIRACGKDVAEIFHKQLGFPVGSKSRIVDIPKSVLKNKECWKTYIRGVFDTDGSVYLKKSGRGKYMQPVVDISSYSPKHLENIKLLLHNVGFNFWTEKTKIRLAGWANTKRFFKDINPQNPTQKARFRTILNLYSIEPALRNKVYQTTLKRDLAKI